MATSPETFGPGSLLWDGMGDQRILLLLGGALIMQTMHPVIGDAVDDRSTYRTDPWGRYERSITSVQKWVYGGPHAIEEGLRLRRLHATIKGVGATGRPFDALDPEPYAWVHLTAFERGVTLNRYFFRQPYSSEEERRLYAEILQLGRILCVPEEMMPPTVEDYRRYFDDMVATTLEAHPTALDVLSRLERTPMPRSLPPALRFAWGPFGRSSGRFQRFVTVGTFPPAVRELLGLSWSDKDERRLQRIGRLIARTFPRLPERVRYLPIAYRARQAARGSTRAVA
jgi:uncharacterized protein (DUF2236 family)